MKKEIAEYNEVLAPADKAICDCLARIIHTELAEAEAKIWHAHPVWFLQNNPVVGYSKQKAGVRLMFWSGADFEEDILDVKGKKFRDASVFCNDVSEIERSAVKRCLQKSREIQWDYKNIVKRKGKLERL
jgi:Domain of unknown function (DU1801)